MSRRRGAWVRYGAPVTDEQIDFAVDHYQVAILQPWEIEAAVRLKAARPDMTVLCYKCLSSTRAYEPGPIHSSGVSYAEAGRAGESWFAHRSDGLTRIEWMTYPGHWQMAVWEVGYQERWRQNVLSELEHSPWDGVMADNDVFDDYYGLNSPLEGGRGLPAIRRALDQLITSIGPELNQMNKLLVPNIAESRREPGRWQRHAAYGGGFEEVWLAWGPDEYLGVEAALQQGEQVAGPGLTIMRAASDGSDSHPNVLYGLAAFWVFGGRSGGAYTCTAHDEYSGTPFVPEYDWDLGEAVGAVRARGHGRSRSFTDGWAAVNFNSSRHRRVTFKVPAGLVDRGGMPAPRKVVLPPHHGVLFRRS